MELRMPRACAFVVAICLISFSVHAQTPQDTLNQYVADLQKTPTDTALREKIIRYVQTMNPAPPIPEEVERFMARGAAAVKGAKSPDDFKEAATEFEKATRAAPWLAETYYNLGLAQDKAGLHEVALKSLRLYLLAAPSAADAKQVKNLIYEVEYQRDKTVKGDAWLSKIDGRRYAQPAPGGQTVLIDVRGPILISGYLDPAKQYHEILRFNINGRQGSYVTDNPFNRKEVTCTISEEGDMITCRTRNDPDEIYRWQR